MRRHRASGGEPEEVYIVTDGNKHRLYSSLSAARGVKSREDNFRYDKSQESRFKIKRAVTVWEEVDE